MCPKIYVILKNHTYKKLYNISNSLYALRIALFLIVLLPVVLVSQGRNYPVYKLSNRPINLSGSNDLFAGFETAKSIESIPNIHSGNITGDNIICDQPVSPITSINPFKHSVNDRSVIYSATSQFFSNTTYQVSGRRNIFNKPRAVNLNGGSSVGSFAGTSAHSSSNNKGNNPTFTGTIGNADVNKMAGAIASFLKPANNNSTTNEPFQDTEQNLTDQTTKQNAPPGDPSEPGDIPVGDGTVLLLLALGIYSILKFKKTSKYIRL